MKNIEKYKSDFVNGVFQAYASVNVEYDNSTTDFDSVCLEYINIMNRLIGPKKRRVHISKELQNKINVNDSESSRIKMLVYDMKEKFENGADVNGHLSKTILRHMEDKFFDDWNIVHLHLCLGNPDLFDFNRTQSSDLLMAVVLNDDAYFIDTTSHSPDDWYRIEDLKIIKNNWESALLIHHKDIIGISYDFKSPEEIKKVRNCNVNSFIHEIDGQFYSVKNAQGYSSAGTSNKAMSTLIGMKKFLESLKFEYKTMEFHPFNVNCFCTIYNSNDESLDIIRNIV